MQLRRWQREAIELWGASRPRQALWQATPGAGKTTGGLRLAHGVLSRGWAKDLVIVCPTAHLRRQWQEAALRFGLQLRTDFPRRSRRDPAFHGAALTYQQLAADAERIRELYPEAMVLPDECHHAGEARAWGDAMTWAFAEAPHVLNLSGTPFRSDGSAIPFVSYDEEGVSRADYSYGYADALADGVVRPIYFVSVGGNVRWEKGGEVQEAAFSEVVTAELRSGRLRAALDASGGWMMHTLEKAHRRLLSVSQRGHPAAAGLVVCMDQEHARQTARRLAPISGRMPALALSDDPNASRVISAFADGTEPWIVAVKQISEGTDIPRIRVITWATNTVAELFFQQAVGRAVRVLPGIPQQDAFVYLPADPVLLSHARSVSEERTRALKKKEEEAQGGLDDQVERQAPPPVGADSLRALYSTGEEGEVVSVAGGQVIYPGELERARSLAAHFNLGEQDPVALAILLRGALGKFSAGDPSAMAMGVEDRRRALRAVLARRVSDYCQRSGKSHREVNAKLKERSRLPVEQLSEEWLSLHVRRVEGWLRDLGSLGMVGAA